MSYIDKINIWNDTISKCNYLPKPKPSIKYDYLNVIPRSKFSTITLIENKDAINCGRILLTKGYNPVVLNLADDNFPGGQVNIGSGAQEESLFRRSNYFQTLNLETNFYPLVKEQLVYSPKVTIIKDDKGNNLEHFYVLPFIACPGIKKPNLINNKFTESDKNLFVNKIKNILNVAYNHNHDSIVLGALGCGAWECPQEEVAELFKKVLEEYKGIFKVIVFAILEVDKKDYIVKNNNLDKSNFKIFNRIFNEDFLKKTT